LKAVPFKFRTTTEESTLLFFFELAQKTLLNLLEIISSDDNSYSNYSRHTIENPAQFSTPQ